MEIRLLGDTDFDTLFAAWTDAFRGYKFQWSRSALEKTLLRRGYRPELSFGAFDGSELAAFTLNAKGLFGGIPTVYDVGTGTRPAYRGRGLAGKIMEESLPVLRQAGLSRYLLEVLEDNEAAISVYSRQGFRMNRKIHYFRGPAEGLRRRHKLPEGFILKEIPLRETEDIKAMRDFQPAWQNDFSTLLRTPEDYMMLGVFNDERMAGYGIIEPATGDLPQIAVAAEYRRRGIGSAILDALLSRNRSATVRLVNVDDSCTALISFMENSGLPAGGAQYEMLRDIGNP